MFPKYFIECENVKKINLNLKVRKVRKTNKGM